MNTKKFIKEVNKIMTYDCLFGGDGNYAFHIENCSKLIEINTVTGFISFGGYIFNSNDEDDLQFYKLLLKYSKCKNWNKPKKKWFE